jgi:hypothetical protein
MAVGAAPMLIRELPILVGHLLKATRVQLIDIGAELTSMRGLLTAAS